MKIAIISSTFPPYRGGMGNVAEEEARLLAARGHDVTVLIPEAKPKRVPAGEPYRIREVEPLFRIGNAACMPELLENMDGYDMVHLHYPFFGGAEFVAFKKWRKPEFKYAVTYHMDVVGTGVMKWIFSAYTFLILPSVLRGAERISVSSRDYAETSPLLRRVWKDIEAKIVEIPFPAPLITIAHPDTKPEKYFLFIGGLDKAHYFKGVDNLITAFAASRERMDGYELRIIGDGDLRATYEALAKEKGIADSVKFLGGMPPGEEMNAIIRHARALVLPSIDRSEAFGLVLLQALSEGIPLIASNLPGVRTIATPDVALRVVPGDSASLAIALLTLATDDALHAKLRAAIPEKLKQYDRSVYAERIE
jgi:glycosyltransferase involved in cell wall biosynthesis